ncbi:MAG: hypothetical protein GX096_00805 [Clostridiales bacterium]|nr:hypothetical protein [Clostridiales bacterium]
MYEITNLSKRYGKGPLVLDNLFSISDYKSEEGGLSPFYCRPFIVALLLSLICYRSFVIAHFFLLISFRPSDTPLNY